ncbi:MAG: hypothetical protein GC150_13160 [Rhizobiales bacterium]|nr:hypothetical protein [Hyphomicrobiales bacterium]
MAQWFPKPEELGAKWVGQKLSFFRALGISGPRLDLLLEFNKIRNEFVHRDKEEFSADEISKLENICREATQGRAPKSSLLIRLDKIEHSYGELSLRQKFCVVGAFAVTFTAAWPREFELAWRSNRP